MTHIMPAAPEELVSALEFLVDVGELNNRYDLVNFIARPNKYPELIELWNNEQSVQGERQDERRAL